MNTRDIAEEYRLNHWAEVMQERNASGMNIREFCKTAGFHENVYYYWQRKLREAACQELLPATNENSVIPSGWAICEPAKAEPSGNTIHIEIGKCRVTMSRDFNPEELTKVCRVLIALC